MIREAKKQYIIKLQNSLIDKSIPPGINGGELQRVSQNLKVRILQILLNTYYLFWNISIHSRVKL
jgi:hypothetical protein